METTIYDFLLNTNPIAVYFLHALYFAGLFLHLGKKPFGALVVGVAGFLWASLVATAPV